MEWLLKTNSKAVLFRWSSDEFEGQELPSSLKRRISACVEKTSEASTPLGTETSAILQDNLGRIGCTHR
jgi:hypothetical protein